MGRRLRSLDAEWRTPWAVERAWRRGSEGGGLPEAASSVIDNDELDEMHQLASLRRFSQGTIGGKDINMDVIDRPPARDIAPLLLDARGHLRVVPASVLAQTNAEERLIFGMRHGLYSFPTEELVAFLKDCIAGRSAIEIGAGHGRLAKALGIPATDNRQQEDPRMQAFYAARGQATVPYGDHVDALDAAEAVKRLRPQVVIACWVTHKFDPRRPQAEGSELGVKEEDIVSSCEEYIFVGNEQVHARKPIWAMPHEKWTPTWLYSRALNGSPDFIASWRRDAKGKTRRTSPGWPWA